MKKLAFALLLFFLLVIVSCEPEDPPPPPPPPPQAVPAKWTRGIPADVGHIVLNRQMTASAKANIITWLNNNPGANTIVSDVNWRYYPNGDLTAPLGILDEIEAEVNVVRNIYWIPRFKIRGYGLAGGYDEVAALPPANEKWIQVSDPAEDAHIGDPLATPADPDRPAKVDCSGKRVDFISATNGTDGAWVPISDWIHGMITNYKDNDHILGFMLGGEPTPWKQTLTSTNGCYRLPWQNAFMAAKYGYCSSGGSTVDCVTPRDVDNRNNYSQRSYAIEYLLPLASAAHDALGASDKFFGLSNSSNYQMNNWSLLFFGYNPDATQEMVVNNDFAWTPHQYTGSLHASSATVKGDMILHDHDTPIYTTSLAAYQYGFVGQTGNYIYPELAHDITNSNTINKGMIEHTYHPYFTGWTNNMSEYKLYHDNGKIEEFSVRLGASGFTYWSMHNALSKRMRYITVWANTNVDNDWDNVDADLMADVNKHAGVNPAVNDSVYIIFRGDVAYDDSEVANPSHKSRDFFNYCYGLYSDLEYGKRYTDAQIDATYNHYQPLAHAGLPTPVAQDFRYWSYRDTSVNMLLDTPDAWASASPGITIEIEFLEKAVADAIVVRYCDASGNEHTKSIPTGTSGVWQSSGPVTIADFGFNACLDSTLSGFSGTIAHQYELMVEADAASPVSMHRINIVRDDGSPVDTPTPTNTPLPVDTPTHTPTPVPGATATPTHTPTHTPTPVPGATGTPTPFPHTPTPILPTPTRPL